ncbi:hypothetical protein EBI01_05215 [Marinomonas rhizomae]|uniref:Uncharacterized protein n=1 Tax=Marinomonas rhizomae TaxID=491948 RepID=A0A366JD05_9GAMM|nr:hypothetical protein [Marinomonas rhizomae]RBP84174.1 hypothetical protein DFP80_10477 [Marinomonas rhizomae]RNF74504.1 hypothetical protein EBI01_05215 [Marinomonas rhizomae]
MVNLSDQNTHDPINYSLGDSSKRLIIHQQDDLFVAHEHLFQNDTPTRFYHHETDTFLFIAKGELYLQQKMRQNNEQETVLKQHQGVWLTAQTINSITLLTPTVELCLIRLKNANQSELNSSLKKVSSGTVDSTLGRSKIKTWPLWQGEAGHIALELYPPQFKEPLYYQKTATQYLLPLNGTPFISNNKKASKACPNYGKVIAKKEPRAVFNPSNESVTMLSVMTTQNIKGRILLLTKPASDTL